MPKGCMTAYKNAEQWNNFFFIEECEAIIGTKYNLIYMVDGVEYLNSAVL